MESRNNCAEVLCVSEDCKLLAFNPWHLICKQHNRLYDRPGAPAYETKEHYLMRTKGK